MVVEVGGGGRRGRPEEEGGGEEGGGGRRDYLSGGTAAAADDGGAGERVSDGGRRSRWDCQDRFSNKTFIEKPTLLSDQYRKNLLY